jgi:curli biogenesis system outer membrane secretion channel CsgG
VTRFAVGAGLAFLGWGAIQPAPAQGNPAPVLKLRVAVMDLSGVALRMQTTQAVQPMMGGGVMQTTQTSIAIPPPAEFARSLTEALTTQLVATNRFMVLERAALVQVQQEQDLGASGRVNAETAPSIGRIIGAQVLITGDITGFTHNRSSIGGRMTNVIRGLNASIERVSASVTIDLRLIDAVTGEVVASVQGTGEASQSGVASDLTKEEKQVAGSVQLTTPLGKASREAVDRAVTGIVANMPKVPWSARVIDFRDGLVYVNAGTAHGITPGLTLEIFDPQPPLIDPVSGANLGTPDKLVGEVLIERVDDQYATARVVNGSEFKRNQVVRLKGQGARP